MAIREKLFDPPVKVIRCEPSADGKFDVEIAFLEVDEKNFHVLYDYFHGILGGRE